MSCQEVIILHNIFHEEATLQSCRQSYKCATCTVVLYVHCVVCGFIKLYKHDFEVMKYNYWLYQVYNH